MSDQFPTDRVVSGSLCYLIADGSVLLLRRARPPHQNLWTAPGGKMQIGESPDDCVKREFLEETGLTIQVPELRAIVTVFDRDWPIHWLLFIYRVEHYTGDLAPGPEGQHEGQLHWIPLAELENLPRPYVDQQYFSHLLSDEPSVWRGKFIYETPETLIDFQRYDA